MARRKMHGTAKAEQDPDRLHRLSSRTVFAIVFAKPGDRALSLGGLLAAHDENGQDNDKQDSCHDANQNNCVHEESFLSRW